jgi:hypothetical protein
MVGAWAASRRIKGTKPCRHALGRARFRQRLVLALHVFQALLNAL